MSIHSFEVLECPFDRVTRIRPGPPTVNLSAKHAHASHFAPCAVCVQFKGACASHMHIILDKLGNSSEIFHIFFRANYADLLVMRQDGIEPPMNGLLADASVKIDEQQKCPHIGFVLARATSAVSRWPPATRAGRVGAGHSHGHGHSHDHRHGDLSLRAAYLRVQADAATSVQAILAQLGGRLWGADWLDPVMGITCAALMAVQARGLATWAECCSTPGWTRPSSRRSASSALLRPDRPRWSTCMCGVSGVLIPLLPDMHSPFSGSLGGVHRLVGAPRQFVRLRYPSPSAMPMLASTATPAPFCKSAD